MANEIEKLKVSNVDYTLTASNIKANNSPTSNQVLSCASPASGSSLPVFTWVTSGGGGTTYTAGNGINIANNTISAKVSSATGNVLTVSSDGLYCAGGGSVTASWGTITGTLANQTDLNTALSGKANTSHTHAQSDIANLTTDLAAKASNTDLTTHTGNSTIHVTSSDKSTWNNKQNALTAGNNINITGNTISATDTTYTFSSGLVNNSGTVSVNTDSSLTFTGLGDTLSVNVDNNRGITLTSGKVGLINASTNNIGGVKVDGTTITVDTDGVISAVGGGGSSTLSGLTDVNISTPSSGQALVYNGTKWANSTVSGSGGTRINDNGSLQSVNNSSTDTGAYAVLLSQYGEAKGSYSTTLGGVGNSALSTYSTVVGGYYNEAHDEDNTILGGCNNKTYGGCSSILGGYSNSNSGYYSVIVGSSNSTLSSNSNYSCLAGSLYGTTNQRGVIANCYNTVSGSGSTSLFRGAHSGFKGARVKTAYYYDPTDDNTLLYINTSDVAVIHLQYIAKRDYSDYTYSGTSHIRVKHGYLTTDSQWGDSNIEFAMNNGKLYIRSIDYYDGEAEVGVWYTIYTGDGSSSSSSSSSSGW